MSKRHNKILNAIFAMMIITSTAANVTQAAESKDEEAKELTLFSQAKISLIKAIKAAEKKTGGKAIEAELNDESDTVQFEIEVLKDGKVYEVIVDGKTGKVLKVSLDDESKESAEKDKE
jgi:uncharacterized membrane protein YkoI